MDGARRSRAVVLTALVAVIGTCCAAPAADALTRTQANRIALRVLKPSKQKGRVVVFTLRRRLGGREVVFQANPRARKRVRFRRPGRARWFFWMDLNHDALFAHRSVGLTIDDRTGAALQRRGFQWFPLVNGKRPPYLLSRAAYHSRRWQIYSNVPRPKRRLARSAIAPGTFKPGANNGPFAVPRSRLADDCLVTIGDNAEEFKRSYRAMNSFADDVGLKRRRAKSSTGGLKATVRTLVRAGCRDVFIYLAGHGIPPPGQPDGGPAGVVVRNSLVLEGGQILNDPEIVKPSDLKAVMDEHSSTTTFKIKVMSCFSGRFIDEIGTTGNLKVIETSSAADEPSLFHIDGVRDKQGNVIVNETDNPTGADEFTNGDVHGLYSWARDHDNDVLGEDNDLARGIAESFDRGKDEDFARKVGLTEPQLKVNQVQPQMGLYIDGKWVFFGANEVQFQGMAQNRLGVSYRQASESPVTELRVVVPGGRQIINQLCPSQLPATQVTSTSSTKDTLVCSGGSLPLRQAFTLNVRTSPNPSAGMGGQISGRQDGTLKGPFPISGP
jgi:hypothetical protein